MRLLVSGVRSLACFALLCFALLCGEVFATSLLVFGGAFACFVLRSGLRCETVGFEGCVRQLSVALLCGEVFAGWKTDNLI